MSDVVSIDTKTIQQIISRLNELTKEVSMLKRVLKKEPRFGSDTWWADEVKEAEEGFKKGKGIEFNSVDEAVKWLNS